MAKPDMVIFAPPDSVITGMFTPLNSIIVGELVPLKSIINRRGKLPDDPIAGPFSALGQLIVKSPKAEIIVNPGGRAVQKRPRDAQLVLGTNAFVLGHGQTIKIEDITVGRNLTIESIQALVN